MVWLPGIGGTGVVGLGTLWWGSETSCIELMGIKAFFVKLVLLGNGEKDVPITSE
ncbi:MAG: hypothetical protein ACK5JH_14065 [Anaerocolumna sp.]